MWFLAEVVSWLYESQQHRCFVFMWRDQVNAPHCYHVSSLIDKLWVSTQICTGRDGERVWAMRWESLISHKSQHECKQKQTETIPSLLHAQVQIASWRSTGISITLPSPLPPPLLLCIWQRPADIYIHNNEGEWYRITESMWLKSQIQHCMSRAVMGCWQIWDLGWTEGTKASCSPLSPQHHPYSCTTLDQSLAEWSVEDGNSASAILSKALTHFLDQRYEDQYHSHVWTFNMKLQPATGELCLA